MRTWEHCGDVLSSRHAPLAASVLTGASNCAGIPDVKGSVLCIRMSAGVRVTREREEGVSD